MKVDYSRRADIALMAFAAASLGTGLGVMAIPATPEPGRALLLMTPMFVLMAIAAGYFLYANRKARRK